MSDWRETHLWKRLQASDPEAEMVRSLLLQRMPNIQRILTSGGTSPTDFTLHDADHSFRVAEWMAEIVPSEVLEKLSVYELALLLLAAYLHDIGMTPEQCRVRRHWSYLRFGDAEQDSETLSEREKAEFRRWLEDRAEPVRVPLSTRSQDEEDFATSLITHYARHRHNDWSEDWIRSNLSDDHLGSYPGWLDDLVQLCRSHHEGYETLKENGFDPRPVGDAVVHLRYLACVLRVADILDVSPDRTPEILLRHRSVSPGSVVYWKKDHQFEVLIDQNTLVVHARPRTAAVEEAIISTVNSIEQELKLCATLKREKPFYHSFFRPAEPLPHAWTFPEYVIRQIVRLPGRDREPAEATVKPRPAEEPPRVKLGRAGVALVIGLLVALGAAAIWLWPTPKVLKLLVSVFDPDGNPLLDVTPSCTICQGAPIPVENSWQFTLLRSSLPSNQEVVITVEDLLGFARGENRIKFNGEPELSMRIDLKREASILNSRKRFRLKPELSWLHSAAWAPRGQGLILVGNNSDDPSNAAHLYSVNGSKLTQIQSIKNPASVYEAGDKYFFYTKSMDAELARMGPRYMMEEKQLLSVSSTLHAGHYLEGVKDWIVAGDDIVAIGDVGKGDREDPRHTEWMSWLVRFPFSSPEEFENVEKDVNGNIAEIVHGQPLQHVYRLGYPHLAALGTTAYFLRMHGQGAPMLVVSRDELWAGELKPLPFRDFNRLSDLSGATSEEAYAAFESSPAVAGIYGWEDYLYLLLKCAPDEEGLTQWFLTKIEPREMRTLHTLALPATSPHVTLSPGDPLWAILEKGRVKNPGPQGQQRVSHLTVIPAEEIDSSNSVLALRSARPQCSGARWSADEVRWIEPWPGS